MPDAKATQSSGPYRPAYTLLEVLQAPMHVNVGFSLPVPEPGIDNTLLLELQEQFLIPASIFVAHGRFRRLALIEAEDVIILPDKSRLG